MSADIRDDMLIERHKVDTATQASQTDRAAIPRGADAWRATSRASADAGTLPWRDRPQAVRMRHGA